MVSQLGHVRFRRGTYGSKLLTATQSCTKKTKIISNVTEGGGEGEDYCLVIVSIFSSSVSVLYSKIRGRYLISASSRYMIISFLIGQSQSSYGSQYPARHQNHVRAPVAKRVCPTCLRGGGRADRWKGT
jgi:hypothetical protein